MRLKKPKKVTLDSEQNRAVSSKGSTLLIAGPGSGKTRALAGKAQQLEGRNVLAVTFTRNAAAELVHRVPTARASTIHSFCIQELYRHYGRSRHPYKFEDYDGLLTDFLSMPDKPQFDWVLVDEVQDLTRTEMAVVMSVAPRNLFAVGDPHQSIYGFGGAAGEETIRLVKDRVDHTFSLNNNYRSNRDIIQHLERVNMRGLKPLGKDDLKGLAIFTRTNRQLYLIAQALQLLDIPFSFKLRKEGKAFSNGDSTEITLGTTRCLNELQGQLGLNSPSLPEPERLYLMTIHCAKGLEFRKVLIWNWGESDQEKNLKYVAISRAATEVHWTNSIDQALHHIVKDGLAMPPESGITLTNLKEVNLEA